MRQTSSLRIYSEEMGDTTVENALVRAACRGVDVQVCGENESGEYDSAYARLARAGVRISYYTSSTGFSWSRRGMSSVPPSERTTPPAPCSA